MLTASIRRRFSLVTAVALAASPLGACAFPPPLSPIDMATQQECRSEAERIYNAQNRYQLSERSSIDSPFSGGGQPATPSDGLADQYSHETMVSDCERHGGVTAQPAPAPSTPTQPERTSK